MIYTMPRMTTRLNLQADRQGVYDGLSAHFSGDGFPGMQFKAQVAPAGPVRDLGAGRARHRAACSTAAAMPSFPSRRSYVKPMTYGAVAPGLFDAIVANEAPPPQHDAAQSAEQTEQGAESMFGKLTWDAIPFHEPIPLITSLVVILAVLGIAHLGLAQGLVALSAGRVHHVHRSQEASASCTSCWRC